ncbi:YicC/YloC family endoribonuclease [Brevundimonas sp.]|uniref:YicC/YloC family endoribonuclease n=1 Tax=Brevundimonas sp. TaxID=1871086 RepID=UPI001D6AD4F0|nr:YicC/YloC family endoribonuclease [Brevundimonas sp.]MBL0947489.1 YicC family protein [Brevundimonas sp.]
MTGLSGMTGFGRAEGALDGWVWTVEARSVNGRGLEVRFRGPPGFDGLERQAKAKAQALMSRGQVTLGVQARREADAAGEVSVDQALLDRYLALSLDLVERGAERPRADGLLALRGVLDRPEEAESEDQKAALEAAMSASIDQALTAMVEARHVEGRQLLVLIEGFLAQIADRVEEAEAEAAAQTEAVRERFGRRMAELTPDTPEVADRIVVEAAALAARADVREELDRLRAHLDSGRRLLGQPPAGRKLDFLMQEFMREANTLCSKSATVELTRVGLALKATIDQLREQVQNVE